MARRSVCVTANVRKSQETRSQTRPLSTFPYVQNAPSVVQARLRGVRARRRLLRRASAGHNKNKNKNKLNRDASYTYYLFLTWRMFFSFSATRLRIVRIVRSFGSFLESVFLSRFSSFSETTKWEKNAGDYFFRGRLFFSFLCCTRYTPKS